MKKTTFVILSLCNIMLRNKTRQTNKQTKKSLQITPALADGLMTPAERFCRSRASRMATALQIFTDQKFNKLINQSLSTGPGRAEARVTERAAETTGWWMRGDKHGVRGQTGKLSAEEAGQSDRLQVIRETSPLLLWHIRYAVWATCGWFHFVTPLSHRSATH